MIGISEVMQTISAMVIFSIILLSANRMIYRNTLIQIEGDFERQLVVLAQDIQEEARTKAFDENSTGAVPPKAIPGSFTEPADLGAETEEGEDQADRSTFNDFDDYNGWIELFETRHGEFNLWAEVSYVDYNESTEEFDPASEKTTYKKLTVFVETDYMTGSSDEPKTYRFESVRNYHAD